MSVNEYKAPHSDVEECRQYNSEANRIIAMVRMHRGDLEECLAHEAEAAARLMRSLGETEEKLRKSQERGVALEVLVMRAQAIIRNLHLAEKPKHRLRLYAKDPNLKTGDKNALANAHCPTCEVLLATERSVT